MDMELEIGAWVTKRTFKATRVCQNIISTMVSEQGEAPAETVAEALSTMMGKPYLPVDVRMMMGSTANEEETRAILQVSIIFDTLRSAASRDTAIELLHKREISDEWIGYCCQFVEDSDKYRRDCETLLKLYTDAIQQLPPLAIDPTTGKPDYTEIVGWPGRSDQSVSMEKFIGEMLKHFEIRPGVMMVPVSENWLLAKYIILRVTMKDDMPIVTIPTLKGTIVLNATPI